jgi:hypothetical protein
MADLSTRNSTLTDLVGMLQQQQDLKLDATVPAHRITSVGGMFQVEGLSVVDPYISVRPTEVCDGHIADKLKIPVDYLRRLRNGRSEKGKQVARPRIDLYDANVNGWLRGTANIDPGSSVHGYHGPDPRSFLVRTFADPLGGVGIMRALLSDSYGIIDNLDVLMSVMEGINASGVDTHFESADLSETRMCVRFSAPAIAELAPDLLKGYRSPYSGATAEENPTVFAGFEVTNSETGSGKFNITPRLIVQICNNGMKMTKDAVGKIHLGSKMDEGIVKASQETQKLTLELVRSQSKDAVDTFLSLEYVRGAIARLEEKASTPVADMTKTVELVSKQLRYTQEQQAGILEMFAKGGQITAGGIMQAVTAYAQSVENPDIAFELENSAVAAMELAAV